MSNGILLASGEMYDYEDPGNSVVTIEDIGLGLSNLCRFAGQLDHFYSVAQHSVYVSYAIEPEYALEGLLHDATEAVLVDVPTPLKRLLPDYKRMERLHEAYMMARFGLDYPMRKEVHIADKRVFAAEVRDLKPDDWTKYKLGPIRPFEWTIDPWYPDEAEEMFIKRYYELVAQRVIH